VTQASDRVSAPRTIAQADDEGEDCDGEGDGTAEAIKLLEHERSSAYTRHTPYTTKHWTQCTPATRPATRPVTQTVTQPHTGAALQYSMKGGEEKTTCSVVLPYFWLWRLPNQRVLARCLLSLRRRAFEAEDWKANNEWVGGINEVMRLVFERLLPCRGGGPAREEEEEAVACWVVERSRV